MKTTKARRENNSMALVAFDTLAYSKKLIEAGFSPQQAEAQAELQSQILSELLLDKLSTKDDFRHLDAKIDHTKEELNAKIDHTKEELNAKIDALDIKIDHVKDELHAKIDHVEAKLSARMDGLDAKIEYVEKSLTILFNSKFRLLYWMFGFMVSMSVAILLKLFL